MEYYIIDTPAESPETGKVYPQVAFDKIKEAFKFRHNKVPNEEPILSATLEKGAKLTNVLSQASIASHGLLIDERVKEIFSKHKLITHNFYHCPVRDNKKLHNYYWMSFVQPNLIEIIDFENTEFYLKKGLKNIGTINICDYNDYKNKIKNIDSTTIVKSNKIILKKELLTLDLFKLPLFDKNIYISNNLKKDIIDNKITGLIVKEKVTFK